MASRANESRFWHQWLAIGAIAGAMAGAGFLLVLVWVGALRVGATASPGQSVVRWLLVGLVSGAVYGVGQGIAQRLFLQGQTPKIKRSLQVNFIATLIGTVVTGLLALLLWTSGVAGFLQDLGAGFLQLLTAIVFLVGGFGGIAQGVAERSLLGSAADASYLRWVLPLALCGHVSGGVVGVVACLIMGNLLTALA